VVRDLQFLVNLLVEVDAVGLQSVNAKKTVIYLSSTLTLAKCCLSNITVHDFCRFRCLTFYMFSLTQVAYILQFVTLCVNSYCSVQKARTRGLYSINKTKHVTVRQV